MRDEGFIRAIEENPRDDTSLLVYADWLDEQGDADSLMKAQFLRVTVELGASKLPKERNLRRKRKRLQELAARREWVKARQNRLQELAGVSS